MFKAGDECRYVGPHTGLQEWEWIFVRPYANSFPGEAGWFKYRSPGQKNWEQGWMSLNDMELAEDLMAGFFVNSLSPRTENVADPR